MAVVYDGTMVTMHSTIWFRSEVDEDDLEGFEDMPQADIAACFRGQANGLLGAGYPGTLAMMTGLQHGPVAVKIEGYESEPPVADTWEEVVEVSYRQSAWEVVASNNEGASLARFDLPPGVWRVRYSANKMAEAHQNAHAWLAQGHEFVDSYWLQFWLAEPTPDRIIKQTTAEAAYRHGAWK
jgi:hypothetical protein